jgi:UDP-GlcNAc:undecaprenyl-phosphate GlcNAc-1-phosphate transferase
MGGIIFGFLTSLVITTMAIPSIVTVARSKNLYDKPQGRKPRRKEVPTLGGLAIFAGTVISLTLFCHVSQFPELPYFIAGAMVLFFIGIKDDILIIAPWWKLSGQVLAAMIISLPAGIQVNFPEIIPGLGSAGHVLSAVITILLIVCFINGFNLIDGIDGLASGIGMISSGLLAWIFLLSGFREYALLSTVLLGSLLGFFYFNVFSRKKKILMGDTGSLMVGYVSSILVLRFLGLEKPALAGIQISSPQSLALAIFIVPLADMVRVAGIRVWRGKSPFKPDRLHIHYRLIDNGLKHWQVTVVLLFFNVLIILCALILQDIGEVKLTSTIILFTVIMYVIEWCLMKRRKMEH